MKQTVRENRQGKVRVAESLILDNFPGVALLRSRMEVCEREHDCYTRFIWFIGYAPEFEPLLISGLHFDVIGHVFLTFYLEGFTTAN